MVDATFQKEIDRNLDRIGDHTDRIIDANDLSPNPVRIAKEAEKIISLAKRIMRLATTEEKENGTDNSRSRMLCYTQKVDTEK